MNRWIALAFLLPCLAAGPAPTHPLDFAAFRDGGGLTGTAGPLPAPPLKLRWTYQTGGSGTEPTSVESVATIKGEPAALFSGCDAHLRAIGVKDGKEVFDTDLGALSGGSPAVSGDRIYVGTDGGHVLCFGADGKQLWDFDQVGDHAMVYA